MESLVRDTDLTVSAHTCEESNTHGLSKLLLTHLKLDNIILESVSCVGRGHNGDARTQWWSLSAGHLGKWCHNQHGTLHGGLCLAILCALSKAHVAMYIKLHCANGSVTTGRNEGITTGGSSTPSVLGVHIQYLLPVVTTHSLKVLTKVKCEEDAVVRVDAVLFRAVDVEKQQHGGHLLGGCSPLCKATINMKRQQKRICSL